MIRAANLCIQNNMWTTRASEVKEAKVAESILQPGSIKHRSMTCGFRIDAVIFHEARLLVERFPRFRGTETKIVRYPWVVYAQVANGAHKET